MNFILKTRIWARRQFDKKNKQKNKNPIITKKKNHRQRNGMKFRRQENSWICYTKTILLLFEIVYCCIISE